MVTARSLFLIFLVLFSEQGGVAALAPAPDISDENYTGRKARLHKALTTLSQAHTDTTGFTGPSCGNGVGRLPVQAHRSVAGNADANGLKYELVASCECNAGYAGGGYIENRGTEGTLDLYPSLDMAGKPRYQPWMDTDCGWNSSIGKPSIEEPCKKCPEGKYAPTHGLRCCIPCGFGETSLASGSTSCICQQGHYRNSPKDFNGRALRAKHSGWCLSLLSGEGFPVHKPMIAADATAATVLNGDSYVALRMVPCSENTLSWEFMDITRSQHGDVEGYWQATDKTTRNKAWLCLKGASGASESLEVGLCAQGASPTNPTAPSNMVPKWRSGTTQSRWNPTDRERGIMLTRGEYKAGAVRETPVAEFITPSPLLKDFMAIQHKDCHHGADITATRTNVEYFSTSYNSEGTFVEDEYDSMTECQTWELVDMPSSQCDSCTSDMTTNIPIAQNNTPSDCVCKKSWHAKSGAAVRTEMCLNTPEWVQRTTVPPNDNNDATQIITVPVPFARGTMPPAAYTRAAGSTFPPVDEWGTQNDLPYTETITARVLDTALSKDASAADLVAYRACAETCSYGCAAFVFLIYLRTSACRLYNSDRSMVRFHTSRVALSTACNPADCTLAGDAQSLFELTRNDAGKLQAWVDEGNIVLRAASCSLDDPHVMSIVGSTNCAGFTAGDASCPGTCIFKAGPPETCYPSPGRAADVNYYCDACPINQVTTTINSMSGADCFCDNTAYYKLVDAQCMAMQCTLPSNWALYKEDGGQSSSNQFQFGKSNNKIGGNLEFSEIHPSRIDSVTTKAAFDFRIDCGEGYTGVVSVEPCVCGEYGFAPDECGPFSVTGNCLPTLNGPSMIVYSVLLLFTLVTMVTQAVVKRVSGNAILFKDDPEKLLMRYLLLLFLIMGWFVMFIDYTQRNARAAAPPGEVASQIFSDDLVDVFKIMLYILIFPMFTRFVLIYGLESLGMLDIELSGHLPGDTCTWTVPMEACNDQDAIVVGRSYSEGKKSSVPVDAAATHWFLYYSCANGYSSGNPLDEATETVLGAIVLSRHQSSTGDQSGTGDQSSTGDQSGTEGFTGVGMEAFINFDGTIMRETTWNVGLTHCDTFKYLGGNDWVYGKKIDMESCRVKPSGTGSDPKTKTVECQDEVDHRPEATSTLVDVQKKEGLIVEGTNQVQIWARRPIRIHCNGAALISKNPSDLSKKNFPTVQDFKHCDNGHIPKSLKFKSPTDSTPDGPVMTSLVRYPELTHEMANVGAGIFFHLKVDVQLQHDSSAADHQEKVDASEEEKKVVHNALSRFDKDETELEDPWITFCYSPYPKLPRRTVTLINGRRVQKKEEEERKDEEGEHTAMLEDDSCKIISLRINQMCNAGLDGSADRREPLAFGEKLLACDPCAGTDLTCRPEERNCEVRCKATGDHKTQSLLHGNCRTEISPIKNYMFETYCKHDLRPKYIEPTAEEQAAAVSNGKEPEEQFCPKGYDPFSGGTQCCKRGAEKGWYGLSPMQMFKQEEETDATQSINLWKSPECPSGVVNRCPWPHGCNVRGEKEQSLLDRLSPDERENMEKNLKIDLSYDNALTKKKKLDTEADAKSLTDREQRQFFDFS